MLTIYDDSTNYLKNKNEEVKLPLSAEDKKTALSMLEYLELSQDDDYAEKNKIRSGVGMAAPQIGINKRYFVIYYESDDEKIIKYALANPKIILTSAKKCCLKNGEGCLSVDEIHEGYVPRYYKIKMKAYDILHDSEIEITARGYDAIVLQHEYDHLDGILYYDRINKFDKFNQTDLELIE